MATINSMISASSAMFNSSTSNSAYQKKLTDLEDKMSELEKNSTMTDDEKADKKKELQDEISALSEDVSSSVNQYLSSDSTSGLISSMFGSSNNNKTDTFSFFGSNNTLNSLKFMNKARIGIENQARTLSSEIALDKARGRDTSDKEKTLSNLTANLSIMDSSVASSVESALKKEENSDEVELPIIGKIKQQLEANQKKLDEKKADKDTKTEETEKTESTEATDTE